MTTPFTLAIASGKGGTGKTLVATSLAVMAAGAGRSVTLVDCDAEAPNDHLFLPRGDSVITPVTVPVAEADPDTCTACGICRDVCAYGAVRVLGKTAIVFGELCHGCGACVSQCPTGAMREDETRVGDIEQGPSNRDDRLRVITGRLDVGQVKTPVVIRAARSEARVLPADLTLLDAPPGVACAAVAATRGADALLLVTEPTRFGLHDLDLSLQLGLNLSLPMGIVINRDGVGSTDIAGLAQKWDVPVLARLPFDRRVAEVYARGDVVADAIPDIAEQLAGVLEWAGLSIGVVAP